MNPGGVRDPGFIFDQPAGTGGAITYGEAFTVQPFGNSLVTMTLTGAQIYELLKEQSVPIGAEGAPAVGWVPLPVEPVGGPVARATAGW